MGRRRERRKPKLHAANVVVRLGDALIVDGAALDLRAGELTVLIGPNGAGKTTLMRALAGLVPAEGRIEIDGKPLAVARPRATGRAASPICRRATSSTGRCRSPRWSRSAAIPMPTRSRRSPTPTAHAVAQGAGGDRDGKLCDTAGHHAVRRRAGAGGAGAGARVRGADPARRRADGLARPAASTGGDGASGPRRARWRRGACDRARPRARRTLCRPHRDHGSRAAGRRRFTRATC